MRRKRARVLTLSLLLLLLAAQTSAITIVNVEVVCPVCQTKNSFKAYASWGSYVYQLPSRFQFVFWPQTSGISLYQCRHCHLTLWMWDFASLKPEEVEKVRKAVASVTVRNNYKDYNDAPISERLAIAEKMYHVLRGKPVEDDAAFWSQFYRVEGYHYARENKPDMARQARLNSLALTRKLIDDDKEASRRKEHLLVAACMKHFTGDETGAIADLDAAAKLSYKDSSRSEDEQSGYDQYLADLIKSYKAAIQEKKVPEDLGGPE